MTIRRRVHTAFSLQDAADELGCSLEDAARDLALLSVMASLSDAFAGRIVFKGGAALRFGHGASRSSRDADATVTEPAESPIPADEVLAAISQARLGEFLTIRVPSAPRTDNKYALDVDRIAFTCAGVEDTLDVEFSYREGIVLDPSRVMIGAPYFEPFEILTMRPVEMAAEKLRALAQRQRGTDLADCVLIERLSASEVHELPRVREAKFRLVRAGASAEHLLNRIDRMRATYDTDVRSIDTSAPDYDTARSAAMRLVRCAWA